MSRRRIAVVTAGLSQPSSTRLLADRLAAATAGALQERDVESEVDVVELRELAHDLTDHVLTGFPTPDLRDVLERVVRADGLVAVTPVFTASYSGLFKLFADVLEADSLTGTPVLVAATGGTERHSLVLDHALRPLFSYLRAVVVPTGVYAASSDWGSAAGPHGALQQRIDRAAGELAALVVGGRVARPADPWDDPTPFAELLRD